MGERGWTLHLHRVTAERARAELSALGFRGAVLAHDAAWCSVGALDEDEDDWMRGIHPTESGVVVVDAEEFIPPDHRALARALDCEVVAVSFDDELGVSFVFASPKGSRGEFSVRLREPPEPSPEDLHFFASLAAAGLVAPTFGAELARSLAVPPRCATRGSSTRTSPRRSAPTGSADWRRLLPTDATGDALSSVRRRDERRGAHRLPGARRSRTLLPPVRSPLHRPRRSLHRRPANRPVVHICSPLPRPRRRELHLGQRRVERLHRRVPRRRVPIERPEDHRIQ